jgi:hypothetical protein
VVTHKTSFGSRSKEGAQAFGRLPSLIRTWERQGKDFFATARAALPDSSQNQAVTVYEIPRIAGEFWGICLIQESFTPEAAIHQPAVAVADLRGVLVGRHDGRTRTYVI